MSEQFSLVSAIRKFPDFDESFFQDVHAVARIAFVVDQRAGGVVLRQP